MTRLAFVVPAYRRFDLTRCCLTQLVRTCDELQERGITATAVVIGDDENIQLAEMLGFASVRQENRPLGRKWNDGIEYAVKLGCEFIVPFGTDNWVDSRLIAQLPAEGTIRAHRLISLVHESGERMAPLRIGYEGGDGIRIIPTALLECVNFRPAVEDRNRAIDTSMRERMKQVGVRPVFEYLDLHQLQIVGFQSEEQQLNDYRSLRGMFRAGIEDLEPFKALADYYPAEAIAEMQSLFARRRGMVAA